MTIKPLFLTDLDDTLFQTRGKCGDYLDSELQPMSWLADGAESGLSTPRQRVLLHWLAHGDLVPVTARSRDALRRVNIVQAPAICANGGCILTAEGTVDRHWHDRLATFSSAGDPLEDVYRQLTQGLSEEEHRHWIATEGGVSLYLVIKSNRGDIAELHALADRLVPELPQGWRCHRNGNNLAFLPPWLGKRAAVAYLLETMRQNHPDRIVIGIGNSWSDAGFMDLCDMAMMPTRSQLWAVMSHANPWVAKEQAA